MGRDFRGFASVGAPFRGVAGVESLEPGRLMRVGSEERFASPGMRFSSPGRRLPSGSGRRLPSAGGSVRSAGALGLGCAFS